jgi:hypothetical protein
VNWQFWLIPAGLLVVSFFCAFFDEDVAGFFVVVALFAAGVVFIVFVGTASVESDIRRNDRNKQTCSLIDKAVWDDSQNLCIKDNKVIVL